MATPSQYVLEPMFPACVVNEKDVIKTIQRLKLHHCSIAKDTPAYGAPTIIHDCVEDLKGRLIYRRDGCGVQVTYCPVCGKKARSRP